MKRIKFPLELEITPENIETGTHWVSVTLKNVSPDTMTDLDVNLNAEYSSFINVLGTGTFIS